MTKTKENTGAASGLSAAAGSLPILKLGKAWTFEVEKADGECIWATTGFGDGKRAPECMASKNKPTAYFNRMEGSTLVYRIPSENNVDRRCEPDSNE